MSIIPPPPLAPMYASGLPEPVAPRTRLKSSTVNSVEFIVVTSPLKMTFPENVTPFGMVVASSISDKPAADVVTTIPSPPVAL